MSALAAVFYRDERTADKEATHAALPLLAPFGPDGTRRGAEGSAAFLHLALHTTPEALHERWPLCAPSGAWLLADARLDNRPELLAALGLSSTLERPLTDGDLILAAHERWGEGAPARLLGDYAYLIWDPRARQVTLVRSAIGLKFLYYRLLPDRLVVATSLRAVYALAPRSTLNERWLAAFLTHRWRPAEETALAEVQQVAPAPSFSIDLATGTERGRRFWEPTVHERFHSWHDGEWIEAIRSTFETAIEAAFRTASPATTSLSGGIDSSSINVVAHRLMHEEGRIPARPVHAYSLRMPAFPDTDESAFRDAAAQRLSHFDTAWIDVEAAWRWADVEAWHAFMSTPSLFPNAWMFQPLYEAAQRHVSRIKVSGAGGDLITGSEDYGLIEAWRSFPLRERLEEIRYFRPRRLTGIWLHAEAPRPLRERWVRMRRGPRRELHTERVEALRYDMPSPPTDGTPFQRLMIENLTQAHLLHPFHQRAEISALHGLELRLPFYDRRVIELMLQMPMRLRIRRRQNRVLFKRAFGTDLPEALLERTRKADFTRFSMESMPATDRDRGLDLTPDMWLARHEWVDPEVWHAAVADRRWVALFRLSHANQWIEGWDGPHVP